ncbi:MAG: DUF349 domain-containing protein [Propionibacteriaceae bacterium]|jgi:hypothetical protein|nr:DUF349 domain-containing protein [Propionibacteriaceae bacterium]
MTETARPAAFGRVDADGTVYVITPEGERMVGQIPDSTAEEALAFFERRFEALRVEADLLTQRVKAGVANPLEARRSLKVLKGNIMSANAVGDLAGLAAQLDQLKPLIAQAESQFQEQRTRQTEELIASKEAMAAQAEEIANGDDWRTGMSRLQELIKKWKHMPHLDSPLDGEFWRRFSVARTTYTRRRKNYFASLSSQFEAARRVKEDILKEAETLAESSDWRDTAQAFRDLMDRWRAAGSASHSVDEELWPRFRACQDRFFDRRREVFAAQEAENQANLTAKTNLLNEAEATVLPVTDLAASRAAFRQFVDQFNRIGRVPWEAVKSIDARVQALEAALDEVARREWARTDPQTRLRARETVALFSDQVAKAEAALAQAEAKGDRAAIDRARASIATYQSWLDQANQTLEEITR